MPGKSRHDRRKHSFQGKKKKGRRSPPGVVAQQQAVTETHKPVAPPGVVAQRQAVTETHKPVAPPRVAAPSASAPTPPPVLTAVRYPYILTELRRIGILAGIMLVILVLALVLS